MTGEKQRIEPSFQTHFRAHDNQIVLFFLFFSILFPVHAETEEQQRTRFQVELEFIQCLANPNYLHCEYEIEANRPTIQFQILPFRSHCTAWLFQRSDIHQLPEVFAVLERTGLCTLHQISNVLIFSGFAAVRALPTRNRQFSMCQIHR